VEEDLDAALWRRYARHAHSLNLIVVAVDLAYCLATWSTGPHRLALLLINGAGLAGIASAMITLPEARIAASPHRTVIFATWCVTGTVLITVATLLDGGVTSPLAWLFPMSVMFTASVHRPVVVLLSAAAGLAGYLLVAATHDGFASHPATVVVQAGYLVALAYATATTAHYRWLDRDARVGLTERLSSLAERDGLTGLLNHRAFHEHLAREVARATREGEPLAVLVVDADHFKAVNDDHGHLVGDDVLKALAAVLTAETRAGDLCARLGGEEFCVALPRATRTDALEIAERVRVAVTRMPAPAAITVSIGVGVATAIEGSAKVLIGRADAALYEAKRSGRNRVCEHRAA
jgi:diguanylate cyclase (GGDEF)-like protein